MFRNLKTYFDFNDWWIGYYRGKTHHYVCPVPCVVVRWDHKWKNRAVIDSPLNTKLIKMLSEIYDNELTRQLKAAEVFMMKPQVVLHKNADGTVTFPIRSRLADPPEAS